MPVKQPQRSGGGRLLWGLLIGLGLAFLILLARHKQGEIAGIALDDFSALVIKVSLLVFFAGAVIMLFRHRLSAALEALVFWGLIGLLLVAGYTYRHDLREVGERVVAELIPGRAAVRGHTAEFARSRGGEFRVTVEINGNKVATVLDTGASSVVLTQEAAKAAGLPIEVLNYTVPVDTANGRTRAAAVTLDRLAIGSIVERAVPALVAQPGQLSTTLLGMTFLSRLESWEVRGDKLLLRGYP
jgi:aspartyl protease family protein